MKRTLAVFGIGILVGWLANGLWRPLPSPGPSDPAPAGTRAPESPAPSPSAHLQTHATDAATPPSSSSENLSLSQAKAVPPAPALDDAPPGEPDRADGLILSEDSIRQMEQESAQLAQQAYAEQVPEGWRIQVLEGDRVFARAGIRSGEIITHDSLRAQMLNPERADLAQRLIAVLERIERAAPTDR